MKRAIVIGAIVGAFALGAFGFDGMTYGALNGGAVIRTKAPLPSACLGVEVWGSPGFFGSPVDSGECDI